MADVTHVTNFYAFYPDDPDCRYFEDGNIDIVERSSYGKIQTPDRWSALDPYMYWWDNCFNNLWNCMPQEFQMYNTYIRLSKTSHKWLRDCNYAFNHAENLTGEPWVGANVREAENMFRDCKNLYNIFYFGENMVNCQNIYNNCNNMFDCMDIPAKVKNLYGAFSCDQEVKKWMYGWITNVKSDIVENVHGFVSTGDYNRPSNHHKAWHLKVTPDTKTHYSFRDNRVCGSVDYGTGSRLSDNAYYKVLSNENLYVHYDPDWVYETYPLRELRLYRDFSRSGARSDWESYVAGPGMTGGIYCVEADQYRYRDSQWGMKCVGVNIDGSETESIYGVSMSSSDKQDVLRPDITPDKICLGIPSIYWSDLTGRKPISVTFFGDFNNGWRGATSLTEVPYVQDYKNCYFGVNNAADMFSGMTGILSIDPEVRDFGNAKNVSNMFNNCYKLFSDFSGFLFTVAEDCSSMMWNCSNITGIPALPNCTNLYSAFENCVNAYTDISAYTWQNCTNFVRSFNGCENVYGTATIPDKAEDNFSNSFRKTNISKFVFESNIEDLNGTFAYDSSVRNVVFNKDIISGKGHTQEEFKTHIVGMFGRDTDTLLDIWLPNYDTTGSSLLKQVLMGDWQAEDSRYRHDSKAFGKWNDITSTYDNRVIYWTDDMVNHMLYNTTLQVYLHYGPMA